MITITRTITESDHHRKRDPRSSTGWVKSVRFDDVKDTDVVVDPGTVTDSRYPRYVLVEAPAPIGPVPIDSPDRPRGGDIHTEVTGVEGGQYVLDAEEVEVLIRRYAYSFQHGLFLASGGSFQGHTDPAGGVVMAVQAHKAARRFRVDLFEQSNISRDPHLDPEAVAHVRKLVS